MTGFYVTGFDSKLYFTELYITESKGSKNVVVCYN